MIHNIFPIKLYEYNLKDLSLNSNILDKLPNEKFIDNGNDRLPPQLRSYQTDHYLHKDDSYTSLYSWFTECINDFASNEQLDCDNLEITTSWANKYPAYTQSHQVSHSHRMSYISAVYYLTPGAPTCFNDPLIQRTNNSLEVHNNNSRSVLVEAQPGKLILFPSWLMHSSHPHQDQFDRWTISFNTMPQGQINSKSNSSGNPSCILDVK
jgi:uncharacterized protein (TIGR02466 family)